MDDAAGIRAVLDRYFAAYAAHDALGCGAVYTEDAICLSPWGPMLEGPAEIAAAHVDWFKDGETNKETRILRLESSGDTGLCLVLYRADIPVEGGGQQHVHGASLSTVARQPDETWKIRYASISELDGSEWENLK